MTQKHYRHNSSLRTGKYRSKFESEVAKQLPRNSTYESFKIKYDCPAKTCTYTPDFLLPNNIVIEAKGLFSVADRKKHLLIREQYPYIDIRFLFQNSQLKLNKNSRTTYAQWCEKHGFIYATKRIPREWIECHLSNMETV